MIALVIVLLGLLIAVTFFAVRSFTSVEGPPMPEVGYAAMTIGIVLSLLVGIVLMTLLFYSSRHGYDERASWETPIDDIERAAGWLYLFCCSGALRRKD